MSQDSVPQLPSAGNTDDTSTLPPPTITLPNCILRPIHPSDVAALQRAADSPTVARFMSYRFPSPYTLQDAQQWIGFALAFKAPGTEVLPSLAICDAQTNTFLGGIGIKTRGDVEDHMYEVGYWLGEASWGKGIATAALRAYSRWLFETFPDVNRLEGMVFEGNEASSKVMRKAGYVYEGTRRKAAVKNGVVMDILVYGLLREECELLN